MTEEQEHPHSAILLIHCPDRTGLLAAITAFIYQHKGNIIHLDQHVDNQAQMFFMRVEWDLHRFTLPIEEIGDYFQRMVAEAYNMQWSLHFSNETPRIALFVSKLPHCLYDILSRCASREWNFQVPVIISNHPDLAPVARRFGVDYHVFSVNHANKQALEQEQLALLKAYRIDSIVLARYMQTLTDQFIDQYPSRIINIHHSFLPAFPGAKPYHSAYERGVKIVGATSHYVTADLDAGPIIEQDVVHVNDKDTIQDFIRKGRDIEKVVLARALWHHVNRKILVYGNRTIRFI